MSAASDCSNFTATSAKGKGMGQTGPEVQALLHLLCRFSKEEKINDLSPLFGPERIHLVSEFQS
jgi:hypothetical protein